MPQVTVVIPCYNQGQYLVESVASARAQTLTDLEIIIVNDGSSDEETIRTLENMYDHRTKIIHTENRGLAEARNTGIAAASSPYILPLDADDLIGERYLEEAACVLDRADEVGIVYCLAERFGAATGKLDLPKFGPATICKDNPIFCSAMFRRSDWELVGGYKRSMKFGWEDWEFWLSILELGRRVVQLPEYLFSYRVREESMTRRMTYWQKGLMMMQIMFHHRGYYTRHMIRKNT